MNKRSIMDTVQLAATLVFALPVGLLGGQFLLDGRIAPGVGFVAIAVLMVALQEYLSTPTDVPTSIAGRVVGKVAKQPDDEE